jgi:autotransporter-associated beta strand protein
MKAPHLKVITPKLPTLWGTPILSLGALWLLIATSNLVLAAVDAVWLPNPGSDDWNTGTNWSTSSAPVNALDTATFNTSKQTTVTLSANATVESITFQPGANAFTIETNTHNLIIEGNAGFVNNSANTQKILNIELVTSGLNPGTIFDGSSTAGNATIENSAATSVAAKPGTTQFNGNSNAGNASITNDGATGISGNTRWAGGTTNFTGTNLTGPTAGNAVITNEGGSNGGHGGALNFSHGSTAGKATITNDGAVDALSNPGTTVFGDPLVLTDTSTAGSAMIENVAAKISGAPGGFTEFIDSSTAGSAIITNDGGAATKTGGFTMFFDKSDGGTAQAITNGNGIFDISGLTSTGMGIGSIAGSGNYFLGSKTLTVGSNDLSTTVSGVIQDGGKSGGTNGSLIKVGTGTLTLSGLNTYTGSTTITGGVLSISQDANLGATPKAPVADKLIFNGGTLQATATFALNPNRGITVNTGGTFDVTGANVLTYGGVISGGGNVVKLDTGTLTLTGSNTYTGGTTITAGRLQIGNGGATGSIIGDVVDNGTLAFDRSDSVNFVGNISGTGSLVQLGAGTLTLTGINTYTGGTTISAGALQIGNGTSITGNVTNNGKLIFEASSAGSAVITNNAAAVPGGSPGTTDFANGSTADRATITNNGGTAGGEFGGTTAFNFSSIGFPAPGSPSTAGTAMITNNGGANSGKSGTAFGGQTLFFLTSTADHATIVNNSSQTANADPGTTEFEEGSTAGNATIINNGAASSDAQGGFTRFQDQSKAGSATIISNGGTGAGAPGGFTLFADRADGGTARAITNGTGVFDISGLTTAGMGIGSIEGSGNYFLSSKTLSVGGNNLSTTVSGVIRDGGLFGGIGGSLTKVGTGTLTLTGANTYTGTTTVNTGSLIVDGSIASPQTVINSGAFLGGHGTIGGSLVNNGMLGQNSSPATLSVANNFTQNAGGTLRIGVAGTAPGQHDLLAVNGHAAVGGTLQLLSLGGFSIQPGDTITFLTAKNGVSGTFNSTQNGLVSTGTVVQVKVTTLADSVQLDASSGSFLRVLPPSTSSNVKAVAGALDSAQGDPRAAALFAFLNSQPLANLPHDLQLIAPTQITSINATAVSVANVQIANVIMRLADVHAGSTGFSSAGLSINSGTVSFESLAGPSGSEGKSGPAVFAPTPDNRWGVFLTGVGEFTDVDSAPGAPGYNVDTGGFTFGVDYRLTPYLAIGLTGGYAHTNVSPDGGGSIDVNGGKLGAYATIFGDGFYLDTAVTGGPTGYQTRRVALQGTASGNTGGADFNVMVATGYDWTKGNLTIGPTASFQYSYVGLNSFTETGSLAPLTFPNQNTQSELSAFGAKATYNWKIGKVIVLPQISAAWQHEYGTTAYSVIASFANGAGNSFSVTGPDIGRDSLLIGAGATVILNDRVSTYLYYDGEFARTNYLSNNVSGGVRISF